MSNMQNNFQQDTGYYAHGGKVNADANTTLHGSHTFLNTCTKARTFKEPFKDFSIFFKDFFVHVKKVVRRLQKKV